MDARYEPGLVSVIVPTYNRGQFITEAMNSVREQTYRPIELLVIDDGSTDETPDLVRQWKKRHADEQLEVHYYRQSNCGAPVARNRGLIASEGEYIQFLDSDDVLHSQKISRQVQVLDKSGADFVFSPRASFRDTIDWGAPTAYKSSFSGNHRYLLGFLYRLRKPQTWSTEGGIYKRSTCQKIGPWDETLEFDQDWEYSIRLLSSEPVIEEINDTLSLRRNHDGSRVGGSRQKQSGPSKQLHVVRRVEYILSRKRLMDEVGVLQGLFDHYLLVVHSALKLDDKATALAGARAAAGIAPSTKAWLASSALKVVSRMPGAPRVYRNVLNPIRKALNRNV
jgi:glycosyltransferase involved in cell wall biosynthesis